MKLQLSISLLTATTTIFTSVLPVLANPFGYSAPSYTPPNYSEITNALPDKCNDVALGHNSQNNSGSYQSSTIRNDVRQGGGGIKAFGVTVKGNGGKKTHKTDHYGKTWNKNSQTLVTGEDCTALINGTVHAVTRMDDNATTRFVTQDNNATARHINKENNETQRYIIDRQMRLNMTNNALNW